MHTSHKIYTYLKEREILLQAEKTFFTFFNLTSKIAVFRSLYTVYCAVYAFTVNPVSPLTALYSVPLCTLGYNDFYFFDEKEPPRP